MEKIVNQWWILPLLLTILVFFIISSPQTVIPKTLSITILTIIIGILTRPKNKNIAPSSLSKTIDELLLAQFLIGLLTLVYSNIGYLPGKEHIIALTLIAGLFLVENKL